jgi:hypothetical protein
MNVQTGLSRLVTVIWGAVSLVGFLFMYEAFQPWWDGQRFQTEALATSIGALIFCYVGWRVSIWVLNGFFSNKVN